jgi:NAD(P)-dependent dehydrogenase (short-subunit alcohol dehydrogenase family)/acyl carrier protein
LLVATSHTHAGAPGERIAYERAALRGLVKSLPQEWPTLSCRLVELPPREHEENATRLLHEALAATKDREVLYRDGGRWVRRLTPVKPEATGEVPWKRGDLVLLSGGLGGVGTELARELLEQHGLRLLLVGRTPLEGGETPAGEADALATRRTHEERLQAFRELERLGPVHHEVADVGDLPRLREAVARAEQRFGTKLAGVFHLAGVFPTRLLAEETPESLADTVYPKLVGAWALSRLLGDEGFFVGFGSVYGLFGGVGVGAYAAAHCALEAFLEDERRKGHARRHCFAFSHWDELGMSRGYPLVEQSLARGYLMIGRKRGLHSLLAGLRSGHSELVVGLDGRRPPVRCHLEAPAAPAERLVAYVASTSGSSLPAASRLEPLADRFGTPSPCELVVVPALPLTPSGELDVGALVGMGGARSASAERILPRTGLERTIAAIWREVLQVDAVDVHTSFFALGGQSVLLVQVLSKLRKALGGELSVVDLFRYPTVSALASHLEKAEAAPKRSVHKATERAQKQREVARQRILTRGRPGAGDKKSP